MELKQIGTVTEEEGSFAIILNEKFKGGLINIEGFSLLKIFWWADQKEKMVYEQGVVIEKPYTRGPEKVGVFATRSQIRPNPICETTIRVKSVDQKKGVISTYFIDAFPGSPVLDIKPYLPSTDITEDVSVPKWCDHWPKSMESSADFDWESEFNFPV